MTRCRTRQKILIYRPFPLAPFQEGLPLGRQLLLDVWKQEPVDWDALRKKYLDERPCHECGEMKRKDAFTKAQWKQDTYRVCKECSARKREAGTPYRCTQCGLWHAAAHFASKHQNPRWSMYRVCLSCDAVKHCFACKRKQTKEYFGTAAWTARKPNRRVCLQCQTRTQGFWTCAACHQRRPQLQFSTFLVKRPSGKDGTQICNTCHAKIAQKVLRKRAATATVARLEPLRKRIRRAEVLRETWEAIAQKRNAQQLQPSKLPTAPHTMKHDSMPRAEYHAPRATTAQQNPPNNQETARRVYQYTCPFCAISVASSIRTGQVDHRHACGHKFRVHAGSISGRTHKHACPRCGTIVASSQAAGRIQVKHKTPSGKTCRQESWQT